MHFFKDAQARLQQVYVDCLKTRVAFVQFNKERLQTTVVPLHIVYTVPVYQPTVKVKDIR